MYGLGIVTDRGLSRIEFVVPVKMWCLSSSCKVENSSGMGYGSIWKGLLLRLDLYVLKISKMFPCIVIFVQLPCPECIGSPCFCLQYDILWNFNKLQQSLVQEPILVMRIELEVKLVML